MILSGLNRQNVEGTCEFLKTLRTATDGKKSFQIILSPVPNGEDALVDQREAAAKAAFKAAWGSTINLSLQIPYHPQLALTEDPHIFRRRRGYLFEAYRDIERRMLRALGHDARTLMRKIEKRLQEQDYGLALRDLRHLIRLDGGRMALAQMAENLVIGERRSLRSKTEMAGSQERATLDTILPHEGGHRFLEFMLDNLPLRNLSLRLQVLIHQLKGASVDLTDRLYERMVKVDPKNADSLDTYAVFLEQERGDLDRAEFYYKRAIEAEPASARHLVNYAFFLWDERGDTDGAEEYFKRAIEAEPEWSPCLGIYATFLWQERDDRDRAEAYFKRSIEAVPPQPAVFGNYGQFLVALGRLDEGRALLLSAFQQSDPGTTAVLAESCFSLWLVSKIQRHDAERWERGFKFLIQQGFKRPRWNFDRMLEQAEKHLPPDEFDYAKALAQAFLDEGKVAELERCERWLALEPLNLK